MFTNAERVDLYKKRCVCDDPLHKSGWTALPLRRWSWITIDVLLETQESILTKALSRYAARLSRLQPGATACRAAVAPKLKLAWYGAL